MNRIVLKRTGKPVLFVDLPFLIGAVFLVIHVLALRAAPAGNPEFALMFWALLNFGPAFASGVQFGEWNYEKRFREGVAHAWIPPFSRGALRSPFFP